MNYSRLKEEGINQAVLMMKDVKDSIRSTRNRLYYLVGFYFAIVILLVPYILDGDILGLKAAIFSTTLIFMISSIYLARKSLLPASQRLLGIEPEKYKEAHDYYKDEMPDIIYETYQDNINELRLILKSISDDYRLTFKALVYWFVLILLEIFWFFTLIV